MTKKVSYDPVFLWNEIAVQLNFKTLVTDCNQAEWIQYAVNWFHLYFVNLNC